MALKFFESEDPDTLDELLIEFVYGDYCTAELGLNVKAANKVARRLGLDYQFKADDSL